MDGDLEPELRPEDARPEIARGPGLDDRLLEPEGDPGIFAANIDESGPDADREGRDEHAFEKLMGGAKEDKPVLESPRLAFVGVDAQVLRAGAAAGDKAPFHPGRETRPSAAAEARIPHFGHDVRGGHRGHGFAGGLVPAPAEVGFEAPGILVGGQEPDAVVKHAL